jgi:hypothetical protein
MAYCYDCLKLAADPDWFNDVCVCDNPSGKVVYGEQRVRYLEGYRDAEEGKEEDVQTQ